MNLASLHWKIFSRQMTGGCSLRTRHCVRWGESAWSPWDCCLRVFIICAHPETQAKSFSMEGASENPGSHREEYSGEWYPSPISEGSPSRGPPKTPRQLQLDQSSMKVSHGNLPALDDTKSSQSSASQAKTWGNVLPLGHSSLFRLGRLSEKGSGRRAVGG